MENKEDKLIKYIEKIKKFKDNISKFDTPESPYPDSDEAAGFICGLRWTLLDRDLLFARDCIEECRNLLNEIENDFAILETNIENRYQKPTFVEDKD